MSDELVILETGQSWQHKRNGAVHTVEEVITDVNTGKVYIRMGRIEQGQRDIVTFKFFIATHKPMPNG